ncbi:SHOCT domain-containing protein [Dehalogenimonas alkenigignens]|uniref:SHOCT domain-containing protein n=1 Tax=Dehalogenimonas alkenigignens TaxID=1217799 RepID=UPI001F0BB6A4|nr:SHOCT domain-containing protein [Dehalogenimonas alkenigignens]
MWYWSDHMANWGFGGFFMSIFWIAIIALVIWAVVTLTRSGTIHTGGGGPRREPLDIAKERYAKGEITQEQFETIKKHLQ